jgi:hypothetical protein
VDAPNVAEPRAACAALTRAGNCGTLKACTHNISNETSKFNAKLLKRGKTYAWSKRFSNFLYTLLVQHLYQSLPLEMKKQNEFNYDKNRTLTGCAAMDLVA